MTAIIDYNLARLVADDVYGRTSAGLHGIIPPGWTFDVTFNSRGVVNQTGDPGEFRLANGLYVYALKSTVPTDNRRILAFRGTEDARDWLANFTDIGESQFTLEAKNIVNQWLAEQLVASNRVELVGHSLGSALVQWTVNDTNREQINLVARGLTGNQAYQVDPSLLHFTTFNAPGITLSPGGLQPGNTTTVVDGEHHVIAVDFALPTPGLQGDFVHLLGGRPVGGTIVAHRVDFNQFSADGNIYDAHLINKPWWNAPVDPGHVSPFAIDFQKAQVVGQFVADMLGPSGQVNGAVDALKIGLVLGAGLTAGTAFQFGTQLSQLIQGVGADLQTLATRLMAPGTDGLQDGFSYLLDVAHDAGRNVATFTFDLSAAALTTWKAIAGLSSAVITVGVEQLGSFITNTAAGIGNAVINLISQVPSTFDLGRTLNFTDLSPFTSAYAQTLDDRTIASDLRTALEEAQFLVQQAGQTVVVQQGIGVNPFLTAGFDPAATPLATGTVQEEGANVFTVYLPYAAGTGGQRIRLTLNGLSSNSMTVLSGGQELTPVNGVVTLVVPEGQQQLFFMLRAQDVAANTVLSLAAALVNGGGTATHVEHPEATVSLVDHMIDYDNGRPVMTVSNRSYTELENDHNYLYTAIGEGTIATRGGNDQIYGYHSTEFISGGNGQDRIYGGDGNDGIVGDSYFVSQVGDPEAEGDDVVDGHGGNDTIEGEGGNDRLYGSDGNDQLYGEDGSIELYHVILPTGDDLLDGGTGDDFLWGDYGTDILVGGDGDDTLAGDYVVHLGSGGTYAPFVFNATRAQDDFLDGGDGVDLLYGDGGHDTLVGGAGNDALYGDYGEDTFLAGEGDLIHIAGNDVIEGGTGDDSILGMGGNDVLSGGDHADTLHGGDGADQMFGGAGDDLLYGEGLTNRFALSTAGGADFLDGGAGSDHLEGGIGNDTLFGGTENDVLFGEEGADSLSGDEGADELQGGAGDDLLSGDAGDDRLFGEATSFQGLAGDDHLDGGAGNDHLQGSGGSDTLSGGTENDILFGDNPLDMSIVGGNDLLDGEEGNDELQGGAGSDRLLGGDGSDVLFGDRMALDPTPASGGNDELDGGSGNDSLFGDAGHDVLTGGTGNDVLEGGGGRDTYMFQRGDGTDSIGDAVGEGNRVVFGGGIVSESVTLGIDAGDTLVVRVGNAGDAVRITGFGVNVPAGPHPIDSFGFSTGAIFNYSQLVARGFQQVGTTAGDSLVGTGFIDRIAAGAGNDVVSGLAGADTLLGEDGDDLLRGDSGDDMLNGGAGNDQLFGDDGIDTLSGGAGDDRLTANVGPDRLVGGDGHDTYVLFEAGHEIVEVANAGIDTVTIGFSGSFVLSAEVENIELREDIFFASTDFVGNQLDNRMTGPNRLDGREGNDTLIGVGDNIYVFGRGYGQDVIQTGTQTYASQNFIDSIQLLPGVAPADVTFEGLGNHLVLKIAETSDQMTVENYLIEPGLRTPTVGEIRFEDGTIWGETEIASRVRVFTGTSGHDTLTGFGNDNDLFGLGGNDQLLGYGGADRLDGGAGDDILVGGDGNDTYLFGRGGGQDRVSDFPDNFTVGEVDIVLLDSAITPGDIRLQATEDSGLLLSIIGTTDQLLVESYFVGSLYQIEQIKFADGTTWDSVAIASRTEGLTLVGTEGSDALTGIFANDTLSGLGGDDTLSGQAGNDLLLGGDGNDTLEGRSGNDTLDGGLGIDTLVGGTGNDGYSVDDPGDVVTEKANQGTDTIQSTITYTLGANVEHLTLTGTSAINGTGNTLNNTLVGNSAANVLSGGTGNDTMSGGAGDDTYIVNVSGDVVTELANEGTDTVQSAITYTLGANLENLTLTGSSAINGTGNTLNNILTGNSAANVLTGGTGNDTYIVGTGDTVTEQAGAGTDTVQSSVTWTLGSNLENLTLTGTSAINGTGNTLDNVLTGNSGANVLTGGTSNDTYVVGTGDSIVENTSAGTDTVQSSITWTLGANLENLTLISASAINGTGNATNNTMAGNSANNVLTGLDGNDTYLYSRGSGQDIVSDNSGASDAMRFGGPINPLDLVISRQANDLRVAIHGSSDQITMQNWYLSTNNQIETIQAGNGQTLLSTQVDQLIQAMAGFTQQTGLTWDQGIDQQPAQVQSILAASWQ